MITSWKAFFLVLSNWNLRCWGGSCSPCPLPFLYSPSCITFELLGATVGLTSFAACGPGRIHIILRHHPPPLVHSWWTNIFKPGKVSKCSGKWENQTALRHWKGELGKASALSADPALQTFPAVSHPARREAAAAVRPLCSLGSRALNSSSQ